MPLVQDGDLIGLDVPARDFELKVSADELAKRRAAWQKPAPKFERQLRGALPAARDAGQRQLFDFDFLEGTRATADPEIH